MVSPPFAIIMTDGGGVRKKFRTYYGIASHFPRKQGTPLTRFFISDIESDIKKQTRTGTLKGSPDAVKGFAKANKRKKGVSCSP